MNFQSVKQFNNILYRQQPGDNQSGDPGISCWVNRIKLSDKKNVF